MAQIASKCSFAYGFAGATGYLYESAKDEIKWFGMRPKNYIRTIMRIGELVCLPDDGFEKAKVENVKMEAEHMAKTLISIFGKGE